jgi:hypothetical protein
LSTRGIKRALAGCLPVLILVPATLAKRNDDVIVMKNGDHMTGEIKKLQDGQLFFKANYMLDQVSVDWREVERLETKDTFSVVLTNGAIHTGVIGRDSRSQDLERDFFISDPRAAVRVARQQVVSITPVESSAWRQLTGSVDYGYSFTGGNNSTTQSSLAGALGYRAERWSVNVTGSSVFNGQSEGTTTGRNNLRVLYAKNLTARWYAGALGELLNSQQQDLTLRATAGGGLGRVLVRTDRTAVGFLSGVLFSREHYSADQNGATQANNAEALFHLKYETYRFKTVNVDAAAYAYPSLTDPGRVRMGLESSMKIELFRNCYWKFSLYENFDTRPPVHAPRNDFGTGASIGWTF